MIKHKKGIKDAFKVYKELNGMYDKPLYRKVITSYYKKVIDAIIYDNLDYKVADLGTIYLAKVKPKLQLWDNNTIKPTLPIDWVNTKKHGKIIYHTNTKRYGYVFRVKWAKTNFVNKKIFRFIPSRWTFKRYLAKILQDESINIDAPLLM